MAFAPEVGGVYATRVAGRMKRLGLCLMWLVIGPVQVFASSFKVRRDLFPTKEVHLNMALTSFDDQYKGCVELMEAEVEELNRTEFATNRVYADAWSEAASMWKEKAASLPEPSGLKPEHAVALMAYTVQGRFHRDFNAAVREAGRTRDDYLHRFHFKAFHFLLTRALHLLGITAEPRCHKVYRGVKSVRFTSERAKLVRFGQFTSSSRSNESALRFGTDSFFTIETCYGVNIKNYSFFPGEEEVLIPPFEKFKVVNFTRGQETNFIHLLSLEDESVYNCVFVKEKKCKMQKCPFKSDGGWSPFSIRDRAPKLLLWGPLLAVGLLGPPGLL
ncbi:GPI-linked NAD(P)(+)--arginine ADP-ribosyltransferase 1 [Pseudonaja textilis]|uniref:GPI-linked NAD(P)(+)--arginine ADP-ribosyltransferase 1 n=1 Tax=Pseudonaja textilis TaxID=8673 RepID=UPI000EA883EC|nr:GPI-linked NAD(P)(+)--arginine ADP-ribosyltransferase 1 [Pseudonaja textilis]